MDDIDEALRRLAQAPAPPGLEGLEDRVLARIAAQPAAHTGLGLGALTIAAALVMGVAGAGVPGQSAAAMTSLAPLGPNSPLAPSTLLAGVP